LNATIGSTREKQQETSVACCATWLAEVLSV